jgi:hypothetical protein
MNHDWAIGGRSGDSQIRHAIADGRSLLNRGQDACSVASDNEPDSNNILPSSSPPMMSDVVPPSSPPVNIDTLVSKMTRRNKNARKTNIDRRDELQLVWDLMNEENRCLRLIFLRWFQDPILPLSSDYPKSWC